jgi:hypothetical protein
MTCKVILSRIIPMNLIFKLKNNLVNLCIRRIYKWSSQLLKKLECYCLKKIKPCKSDDYKAFCGERGTTTFQTPKN